VSFDPQPQIHGDVIFHVVRKFLAYFPAADFHIESLSAAPSDVQIDEANPHQIHQSPKKSRFFCAIVFAAKCETFREPSYPTTARRTTGTHNWMREKASANRLRFRTGLQSPRRKQKEEGS
jgi:hypothetical protein